MCSTLPSPESPAGDRNAVMIGPLASARPRSPVWAIQTARSVKFITFAHVGGDQLILSGSMSAVVSVTAFALMSAEDGQDETEVWEPIMTTQRLTERWFYWGMDRPDPTGLGMLAAAWLVPAGLFLMLVLA